MSSFIYRMHSWLGIVVALPVLGWASSGLLYAWPNVIREGTIEQIQASKVVLTPSEAIDRANEFAGRQLPITALTLLVQDGRPHYQAVGGMGGEAILIDAETGSLTRQPPPKRLARYFRQ